jgi:hypothetical protein
LQEAGWGIASFARAAELLKHSNVLNMKCINTVITAMHHHHHQSLTIHLSLLAGGWLGHCQLCACCLAVAATAELYT